MFKVLPLMIFHSPATWNGLNTTIHPRYMIGNLQKHSCTSIIIGRLAVSLSSRQADYFVVALAHDVRGQLVGLSVVNRGV